MRLFAEEPAEGSNEAVGLLDVGQMAAVRDNFEGAFSETSNGVLRLRDGEYPVGFAPDNERRDLQTGELIQQHLALPACVDLGAQHGHHRLREARQLSESVLLLGPIGGDALGVREEKGHP